MAALSGVVLCGGASRRMGTDKGDLVLKGRTFLEIQAEKLRAAGVEELMLSGGRTALPNARLIPDLYPGRGPLGGLHACLKGAGSPHCLVVSVDVPLVPVESLRELAAVHRQQGNDATLLAGPRGGEPLIAVYRRELAPMIEELICEGTAPVKALLGRVKTGEVPYGGDPRRLRNCNTPEDYQAICRLAEAMERGTGVC